MQLQINVLNNAKKAQSTKDLVKKAFNKRHDLGKMCKDFFTK